MTRPLVAVRDFFVAPPGGAAPARADALLPPPSIAVLGDASHADAVACALALCLARGRRASCALVCTWPPGEHGAEGPGTGPARRLAARLAHRGVGAVAAGRLTRVVLPPEPAEAVAAAGRAGAAARAPCVVALGGPRSDDLDALLALQDVIVLALRTGADPALARLAAARLAPLQVAVVSVEAPAGAAWRALARRGLLAAPALRAALAPALEAVA